MSTVNILSKLHLFFLTVFFLFSCRAEEKKTVARELRKQDYQRIKDSVLTNSSKDTSDASNLFDKNSYNPAADTTDELLINLGHIYQLDSSVIIKFDTSYRKELTKENPKDTILAGKEVFTYDLHKITLQEVGSLRYNLDMIRKAKLNDTLFAFCRRDSCPVWANVSKAKQQLFLYMNGELLDSFKVSTGLKKYETPDFDTKPNGLMFKKYTSKQYPGGNYKGLGNMPYVVFIKGGYAIHGTTFGNVKKLGTRASHGCIRLHPDHAHIFFELVKFAGVENVWITVEN